MSEYQYYEFQAIDRALTKKEQGIIGKLSSRVRLTPRRAIFTYSYSDLPGDAEEILIKYFDAMLYLANWGTSQLMFRFPIDSIDFEEIIKYSYKDSIKVEKKKNYLIINITFDKEEGGFWIEENNDYLDYLIGLREEILAQDYRVLYLARLKAIELDCESSKDEEAPPIPYGLNNLSDSLKDFIDIFELGDDLI